MQAQYNEAEVMFKRALEGYEKTLGPEVIKTDISVSFCLRNLGDICYEQNQLQTARQYDDRAHYGFCTALGADDKIAMWLSKRLEKIALKL